VLRLRPLAALASLALASAPIACSSSDDSTPPPAADAGTPADATAADAAACPPLGPVTGATTWTSLYADLFGPTGKASCAGDGTCHGSPTQDGTKAAFYLCDSKDGCYKSLRSKTGVNSTDSNLVRDADVAAPKKAALFGILRVTKEDCSVSGFMPKRPPYRLTREEVARIEAWIAAGANDD
jgi:hypothetical protein